MHITLLNGMPNANLTAFNNGIISKLIDLQVLKSVSVWITSDTIKEKNVLCHVEGTGQGLPEYGVMIKWVFYHHTPFPPRPPTRLCYSVMVLSSSFIFIFLIDRTWIYQWIDVFWFKSKLILDFNLHICMGVRILTSSSNFKYIMLQ